MKNVKTVEAIQKLFADKGLILEVVGNPSTEFQRIAGMEVSGSGDLVFMDKKDYLPLLKERRPTVVVTSAALKGPALETGIATIVVVANVPLAHALIKQLFAARDFTRSGWTGVHPSAVVHETVKLADDVVIEPRAVIGKGCTIGRGTRIMSGVVIENDVVIGEDSVMHPNVVVGYGSKIGREVVIEAGTILGSSGFGFAQDAKRKSYSIPQTGIVVVEDRVRIGAGCCIDRAAYEETRIGAGTKIDNLCHIAHGVQIGQDCLLTAMLCVAGSTKIGDRVITSGQTGILDHMNVCSDAILLHRAGVTKDVEKPGAYAGLPLQPLSDYMKNTAVARGLVELRNEVKELSKQKSE